MLPRGAVVKARRELLGDDLDRDRDLDVRVEADRNLVGAQRLDRPDDGRIERFG